MRAVGRGAVDYASNSLRQAEVEKIKRYRIISCMVGGLVLVLTARTQFTTNINLNKLWCLLKNINWICFHLLDFFIKYPRLCWTMVAAVVAVLMMVQSMYLFIFFGSFHIINSIIIIHRWWSVFMAFFSMSNHPSTKKHTHPRSHPHHVHPLSL